MVSIISSFDEVKPPFQNQSHQIKSRMTDYLTITTEEKHLVEAQLEIFLLSLASMSLVNAVYVLGER